MPFWLGASVSGLVFVAGLVALLARAWPMRAMGAALMLNGAALLFLVAGAQFKQMDGQAAALLLIALVASEYVIGLSLWRRAHKPVRPREGDLPDDR